MERKTVRSSSRKKTKEPQTNHVGTNNQQAQAHQQQERKVLKKNSMTARDHQSKGAPPADLLVCFPSRSHLSNLVAKPICSPSRPIEPTKRHHQHHLSRSSNRAGLASPSLWAKTKPTSSEIAEPTSPKVTCAGQIKVRPKTTATSTSSKNWQSVMEEIERLHNNRKHKKKPNWFEAIGIKKDMVQFPTFFRAIRLDHLRCFSPSSAHEEDQVSLEGSDHGGGSSRTIFSKWFMILQENKNRWFNRDEECEGKREEGDHGCCDVDEEEGFVASAPPPNALLLMRCRSAPAKSLLEEKEEKEVNKAKFVLEEEKKTEGFILKCYATDFSKVSGGKIPKETWFVGETKIPLSMRSRSCKT